MKKLEEFLKDFQNARIKPIDGMAVTADVWEKSHDYHRAQQSMHNLFGHGAGIASGLEVLASDPPDNSIYILPGVAFDRAGQMIVLQEPVAYDLGAFKVSHFTSRQKGNISIIFHPYIKMTTS